MRTLIGLVLAGFVASCSSSAVTPTAAPTTAAPSPSSDVGRYPSGIPTTFDGQQVFLGFGAVLHARTTTNATPFLVGGWFGDGSMSVCTGGVGRDPSPLLSGCATVVGGDSPFGGAYLWPGPQGQLYWDDQHLSNNQGPAIVQVHTHDSRAAACRPDSQAECQAVLVVDHVLWSGDAWTRAVPLSVSDAIRRLGSVNILEDFPIGTNATGVAQRFIFPTPHLAACPAPWPREVYDLHGDPRFGLVAIFPDVASRQAAEATSLVCLPDDRIVRPTPAAWVAVQNVLVLTYGGSQVGDAVRAVLTSTTAQPPRLPFPSAGLDESYRVVVDFEASRAANNLSVSPAPAQSTGDGYNAYVEATYQRYEANALGYVIGPGEPATATNVGATVWASLTKAAVPGTPRVFEVDHPSATDPAFRRERLVAYEVNGPAAASWGLMSLDAAP